MTSEHKVIIVGAGFGQLPAIMTAKAMGLYVHTVDRNPDAVGMSLAHQAHVIDVLDKEGILALAKRVKADGIMTMQSDLPVESIGFVNDTMGLAGVSHRTAIACSRKSVARQELTKNNVNQPAYQVASSLSEVIEVLNDMQLPVVVKAVDSSGSRGVTKVERAAELKSAYEEAKAYTRQDFVLVEEFIEGVEYGAQTFSVNGKCIAVVLHDDIVDKDSLVPIGHSMPCSLSDSLSNKVKKTVVKAVEALGIDDGPANVDFIFDSKTKTAKIIEIGARIGATCLPELVQYHTGVDWVKQAVRSAIGKSVSLDFDQANCVAAQILFGKESGTLIRVDIDDMFFTHSALIEYQITVRLGDKITKLSKGTDRIGKVLASGSTVQEAVANASLLAQFIRFIVE